MQVHEVPPCTDSYNLHVVAGLSTPLGGFVRLGLTAPQLHAIAMFAKRKGEIKKNGKDCDNVMERMHR